jgi:hypothetical protein
VTFTHADAAAGLHGLRATLKFAARRGLRCLDARELPIAARRRRSEQRKGAANARGRQVMDMSRYAGSAFISYDDVKDGLIKAEIALVEVDAKFNRPVLTFTNGLRFTANVTNVQTLLKTLGAESDDWVGERVELYPGKRTYQGEEKDSVLLRVLARDPGEKKRPPPKREGGGGLGGMNDKIPFLVREGTL